MYGRLFRRPLVCGRSLYAMAPLISSVKRGYLIYLSITTPLIGKCFHPSLTLSQPLPFVPNQVRPAATRTGGAARANKSSRIRRGQRTVQLTNTPVYQHERATGVARVICGLGLEGGPASHRMWARCVDSASLSGQRILRGQRPGCIHVQLRHRHTRYMQVSRVLGASPRSPLDERGSLHSKWSSIIALHN
jgi:hypothetical protein